MNRLRLPLMSLCFALLSGLAGTATADVTVSTSNAVSDAKVAIGGAMEAERVVLSALNSADIARLARRPENRGGINVYSRDFLDGLPSAKGGAQWECLAQALYFEARGESVQGQFAVAEVILNRVDSKRFPDTICKVVNQGTGRKFMCQFTYTCDGRAETIHEPRAWERVGKIARLMLDGAPRKLTGGATHYHTTAVRPKWSRVFALTATIGVHRFYTMDRKVAANG